MIASTLCYIKKNGQTLLLHRNKKNDDIHEDKWTGLGGKFLPGETAEECVIREVKEESGLDILSPQMRGVMTFPKFKNNTDWLVFLFTVKNPKGQLTTCDEGHLQWIPNSKVLNLNLWEGDKLFINWLNQDRFFLAKFIYEDKKLTDYQVTFYPL